MISIRRAADRGRASFGWLDSRHSFSFGHYYDPEHMGFGPLRVINEDRVQPGKGFGRHGHSDMEILSYVLDGALEHKDSLGTGSVIRPGDVQRMTAGTGVEHSEFNASATDPVHFLQIWIEPERASLEPGYEQKNVVSSEFGNRLQLVGSRDGRDGSVTIHQDVDLYAGRLAAGSTLDFAVQEDRKVWVQVARGDITLNDESLSAGDGAAVHGPLALRLTASASAEVLLFDMAEKPS